MPATEAKLYTLKNSEIEVTLTNYGARITGLLTADHTGKQTDVVAGFATVDDYLKATSPYYGATIGRYANRIANGRFELNGATYQLPINNGPNCLHGGGGFHDKIWNVVNETERSIVMFYTSPDGEDFFPGTVSTQVTFSVNGPALHIDYEATTDATTVLNLTNHAYFNLNGEGSGSITGHQLYINADTFVPVNENQIPTGELEKINGTPFDFNTPHVIGDRIDSNNKQLEIGHGYDHTYVLNKPNDGLSLAARLVGDVSGIFMEVFTTEPGMQFYTGNFMDGTNVFKCGIKDDFRTTLALETQHFPDSPNKPSFPSTLLQPGQKLQSTTIYKFGLA